MLFPFPHANIHALPHPSIQPFLSLPPDPSCVWSGRGGLEFAFLVMGGGFCCPTLLRVLRHVISTAQPSPRPPPPSPSDASLAQAFLIHHLMAPIPEPSPHLIGRQPDPSAPSLGDAPGPSVGPRPSAPQGRPHGPQHVPPEGKKDGAGVKRARGELIVGEGLTVPVLCCAVAWINDIWSDPQSAAYTISLIVVEGQPILKVGENREEGRRSLAWRMHNHARPPVEPPCLSPECTGQL